MTPRVRLLLGVLAAAAFVGAAVLLVAATVTATGESYSSWSSRDTREYLVWVYRLVGLAAILALTAWRWPRR